jgi:Tol biopolymer transport system component
VRALICGLSLLASAASSVSVIAAAPIKIREWTPEAIYTDQYESTPTFTGDGREMYFMRSDREFSAYQILRSQCESQGWSAPAPASFALGPPINDADPFVTPDGLHLYFVSSRPFAGKKGDDLDIWMVERQTTGDWGRPVRLPEPVNSPQEELLPRVSSKGRIYFGSDRPGGFGGTDIYIASPLPRGGWRVDNLGRDVNTAGNDYEADVSRDERTMVVVSDRGDRSHLYRFARAHDRWRQTDRIPARDDVFQVGPLLSPKADRLLFAQVAGERSGKIFLADLVAEPDMSWPPNGCVAEPRPTAASSRKPPGPN